MPVRKRAGYSSYKKRRVAVRRSQGVSKASSKRLRYRGTMVKNSNYDTNMGKIYQSVLLGRGLPNRVKTTLTYRDYVNLNTATGINYAEVVIQGNSVYDPNYAGLTRNAQPRYFDQLMTLYSTYRVNASRLKVWITSGSSTVAGGSLMAVIHMNSTATYDTSSYFDNPDGLLECNNLVSRFIGLAGSEAVSVMTAHGSNKMIYPSASPTDKGFSATASTNPTSPWYYHLTLWDQARNTTSGTIIAYVNVELEFDCEFFELNNVSPS